jgi:thiamine biosynthesis protein ThiS
VNVIVNGEPRETRPETTVLALLESLGCAPGRVAVELNGGVLKRADFAVRRLGDGDRIEVVQFVGGG